jgi:hypothetical protein
MTTKPITNLREINGGDDSVINDDDIIMKLSVNQDILVKLESAIQLYCSRSNHHRYRRPGVGLGSDGDRTKLNDANVNNNNNNNNNITVSFSTFQQLASKIDGQYHTTGKSIDKKTLCSDNQLSVLSREERIFHDFYCVAVPAMYSCAGKDDDDDDDDNNNGSNKNNDINSTNKKTPRRCRRPADLVYVDLTSGSSNRFHELRRLIHHALQVGVPKSKSDEALRLLDEAVNSEPKKKKIKAGHGQENDPLWSTTALSIDDVLRSRNGKKIQAVQSTLVATVAASSRKTKTTIEERIQARAKKREQDLEEAKEGRLDPREDRIAVADILYAHACRMLRQASSQRSLTTTSRFKSSKFTSSSSSSFKAPLSSSQSSSMATSQLNARKTNDGPKPKTRCVLTFGDVVQALYPRPRKEISKLLLDISCVSPGWIIWTTNSNSTRIPKDTRMTIETANYKSARAVLNGESWDVGSLSNVNHTDSKRKSQPQRPLQRRVREQQQQQQLTPVPGTSKVAAVTISTKKTTVSSKSRPPMV